MILTTKRNRRSGVSSPHRRLSPSEVPRQSQIAALIPTTQCRLRLDLSTTSASAQVASPAVCVEEGWMVGVVVAALAVAVSRVGNAPKKKALAEAAFEVVAGAPARVTGKAQFIVQGEIHQWLQFCRCERESAPLPASAAARVAKEGVRGAVAGAVAGAAVARAGNLNRDAAAPRGAVQTASRMRCHPTVPRH